MQSILFIVYFLLCAWLISAIPFFKRSGISKWMLILLFFIKITAGFVYAWYYSLPQNIATADTWKFYNASLTETNWLLRDPAGFIRDYFHSPYQQGSNLFSGTSSYWNDLDYNTFVKGMAVVNVITDKGYYTNLLLYNFIYLFGPVALFRLVLPYWKQNKLWLILPIFLLPSFLFWCSGLHKDGLIFSAMMMGIYGFQKQITKRQFIWKYTLMLAVYFALLFALRNVLLLLLIPALTALFFSSRMPRHQWLIFGGIYMAGLVLFFISPILSPALDFPRYVVSKQAEFNILTGNSRVILPSLQPAFVSFAKFFPYAADLIFFRPHISELKGFTYLLAFVENSFLILLLIAWLFFHKPYKMISPLLICFLFFSFSVLFLCGYTVTFIGAIVRYKSIIIPVLATTLLVSIDYKRLGFTKLIK